MNWCQKMSYTWNGILWRKELSDVIMEVNIYLKELEIRIYVGSKENI